MKVPALFTRATMRLLSLLTVFLVVFSIVDQMEYGIGKPLYFILPLTLVLVLLSYGFWHCKTWSVIPLGVFFAVLIVQELIDFGRLFIDIETIMIVFAIIGLYMLNWPNLQGGFK